MPTASVGMAPNYFFNMPSQLQKNSDSRPGADWPMLKYTSHVLRAIYAVLQTKERLVLCSGYNDSIGTAERVG